mmetsp:Transcript_547/g.1265  ORF Transcript_547/g.1265 Transcript_547/m.1265 type:complete len:363 (-) Transcript_547:24-1112(-)|eukprot:CAMPEP_0177645238 /NCGR_PEP_ID=MMETSP0447-20121125/9142_1 /TAXON_ID=0 /ORGANISM="Stygamoeba regulata, Strain BSH-02190019" /LENGTH=362 /DNA_ID=CAMNT_0019147707 /DNA_START=151 /DNA_END=1239 /DNA_ORIENTATION=-
MAAPKVTQLADSVTCHSWNADRSKIAFCPNNNEIHIWSKSGTGFEPEAVLKEHDAVVTGIDWAPNTNRIVSCSQDRNAYVWTLDGATWRPVLVILRINRAATFCKWSPNEDKFAVASGAKAVSVCYFEEDNDWWISKHIKNHDSTVVSVSWHPNNVLLATASTDCFIRVFSAFVKGVDKRPGDTPFGARLPWNGKPLGTWESYGWVQDVAWSPSGFQLGYVAHDSTIGVIDLNNGAEQAYQQIVKIRGLPFQKFMWLNESSLVAVGHSCNPTLFSLDSAGAWSQTKLMDEAKAKVAAGGAGARAAFNRFQSMDTKAQTESTVEVLTKHKNCITDINIVSGSPAAVNEFSTTGLDGHLVIWKA